MHAEGVALGLTQIFRGRRGPVPPRRPAPGNRRRGSHAPLLQVGSGPLGTNRGDRDQEFYLRAKFYFDFMSIIVIILFVYFIMKILFLLTYAMLINPPTQAP